MRIHLALAILTFAAAAPVHAQRGPEVHRGDGYQIVLPAKCSPMPISEARALASSDHAETQLMAVGQHTLVMVIAGRVDEIQDTTMATRRAMLHLARAGMLHAASGDAAVIGEAREFERDDRVGVRISVTLPPDRGRNFALHGTAELSVARRGGAEIWVVMVFDERDNPATRATAERVLDSFRLTEAAPRRIAEKGSVAEGGESDLAAKP
jgi:hypothetical protein